MRLIEELYELHAGPLKRYAAAISGNAAEAEDLVQEAYSRAIANIDLLRILPPQKRRAWLFRVVKNGHIDLRRRERFEMPSEEPIDVPGGTPIEMVPEATAALGSLPEKFRDVVVKHYWLGFTSSEIARSSGIPAATIRFRLHTALGLLKSKMVRTYKEDL
jgi:RNA polymerase sigma-70 factor, ECF subfamily